jgi:hypothetical protein
MLLKIEEEAEEVEVNSGLDCGEAESLLVDDSVAEVSGGGTGGGGPGDSVDGEG